MTNEEAIQELVELKKHSTTRLFALIDKNRVEALDLAIKALEQTRWIPVSERLPETDTDVLVTNGIGMYIGWIDPTDKGWRVDSESEYFFNDEVIAWMPLPEPYKTKAESEVNVDECNL